MNRNAENIIRTKLSELVKNSPHNALAAHDGMRMYDAPLISFASAADSLFEEFLRPGIIGPDFILPREWLSNAKTVVSYFLPFSKQLRDTNRLPGLPSEEWVSARIDGEAFNNEVRVYLIDLLHDMNASAVAPCIDSRFKVVNRVSNWSERHAAYVAGLGTFGLHRALITEKGSAGRIGSVITTLEIMPTKRDYDRYDAYCPYLTQRKCGACMHRCPPYAISQSGKSHEICSQYIDQKILPIWTPRYGCAKCNIGVPCECRNPVA